MGLSKEEALRIAGRFADEVAERYPGKVLAVYAIGSLGSDYYRPGQSDIDTAVITSLARRELQEAKDAIEGIADRYWHSYQVPKGFGAIVFAREQLFPPYLAEEELVLEILRLKTQSRCLRGDFDLASIPAPSREEMVNDARHFQAWIDGEKAKNPDFGISSVTMFVNSTLIALKRYLMIEKGILEFNKFKVIDLYLRNDPPMVDERIFRFLQDALRERNEQPDPQTFAEMLRWHDALYEAVNARTLYRE